MFQTSFHIYEEVVIQILVLNFYKIYNINLYKMHKKLRKTLYNFNPLHIFQSSTLLNP